MIKENTSLPVIDSEVSNLIAPVRQAQGLSGNRRQTRRVGKLKTVGIIFGGNSFEHEVSKMTAESIIRNIDKNKFKIKEIYIEKDGMLDESLLQDIDVVFLAVHGPNCEDGKLQQFLENKKIRYTGSGVGASHINMDKILMHDHFKKAGLPTVEYVGFDTKQNESEMVDYAHKKFGFNCFVKPNNGGSSIGINRVINVFQLRDSIKKAFNYDDKIIIERAVENPREIEIAILGNDNLMISEPGEILSSGQFYSYQAKYFSPFETEPIAKNLTKDQVKTMKEIAITAYKTTGCRGYARVDLFIDGNDNIFINEINTLPGFTPTSMFPKMMEKSGISYQDLITKIIELALEK